MGRNRRGWKIDSDCVGMGRIIDRIKINETHDLLEKGEKYGYTNL